MVPWVAHFASFLCRFRSRSVQVCANSHRLFSALSAYQTAPVYLYLLRSCLASPERLGTSRRRCPQRPGAMGRAKPFWWLLPRQGPKISHIKWSCYLLNSVFVWSLRLPSLYLHPMPAAASPFPSLQSLPPLHSSRGLCARSPTPESGSAFSSLFPSVLALSLVLSLCFLQST